VPLSIYLHIPFCTTRCGYCDFNTYAGLEAIIPDYVGALTSEITSAAEAIQERDRVVHTVYFGGGTPSLLESDQVASVLHTIETAFTVLPGAEISLEANPGTVSRAKLASLRRIGVNRLSMGAQSSSWDELRLLERTHTSRDVEFAVSAARAAGFANLSLDLIYGLPGQSLHTWIESLRWAIGVGVDHLSAYALTLEKGTPLTRKVVRGLLPAPDPDLAADMYQAATDILGEAEFVQYEISNWARRANGSGEGPPRFACRHNLQYWRNRPYLGVGAGAHGSLQGWRYRNVLSPRGYIDRGRSRRGGDPLFAPARGDARRIPPDEDMDDTMMLGLRLTEEGIDPSGFQGRYGQHPDIRYGDRLRQLGEVGLVERDSRRIRLTPRGRLLGNQVFQAFV
jgi:oxygen-independent coproporphyrinogen-3 oxidase